MAQAGHYYLGLTPLVRIMYIMLNTMSTYANSSLVWSPIPLRF